MKLTIHRKTHIGKIARLPHAVREELNRRLQNGETGKVILPWLNALPAVQAVLAGQFAAVPVNHQNLSNWRHSGYQDWLEQERYGNLARELAQNAGEIAPDNSAPVIANSLSTVLMAELAVSVYKNQNNQDELANPSEKFNRLRGLLHTVCEVRREDHRAARLDLHRDRRAFALEKALFPVTNPRPDPQNSSPFKPIQGHSSQLKEEKIFDPRPRL